MDKTIAVEVIKDYTSMEKSKRNRKSPGKTERREKQINQVHQLPSPFPASGIADTVQELVEIYESVERSYRAAIMAGETPPGVAQSTNY